MYFVEYRLFIAQIEFLCILYQDQDKPKLFMLGREMQHLAQLNEAYTMRTNLPKLLDLLIFWIYRISMNSFCGNYSFLNLEIVENSNSCGKFQFFS